MGTIRNEMTIVHHWKRDELEEVRKDVCGQHEMNEEQLEKGEPGR